MLKRLKAVAVVGLLLLMIATTVEARPLHKTHSLSRPHAWCGWWLGQHLGLHDRSLWLARNWTRIGLPARGPGRDVIAVWPHHVGIVRSVPGPGRIVLLSGNDGHAVRERERSTKGIIAYRRLL